MTLIVDAGALVAQADATDPKHEEVTRLLRSDAGPLVTSELAVAEADYLILRRLGPDVELAFADDLVEGTYAVDCLTGADWARARSVIHQYQDLRIGLADASLVVLAARHHTKRILTFDHRAFRSVAPLQGGAFTILPADA